MWSVGLQGPRFSPVVLIVDPLYNSTMWRESCLLATDPTENAAAAMTLEREERGEVKEERERLSRGRKEEWGFVKE